ncbi:hypothetical protein IEQ34_008697 [Dendrobium chrysotoxum]|uniref:Uncharacterized protein n=1 Tax=Dendrobium chrysotoxum TaxID=161865 RepID=A0AAV7GYN0_DENCH|nr:hypothetical protein IEQ34_008697 [Dendrobium chrysotoxum]
MKIWSYKCSEDLKYCGNIKKLFAFSAFFQQAIMAPGCCVVAVQGVPDVPFAVQGDPDGGLLSNFAPNSSFHCLKASGSRRLLSNTFRRRKTAIQEFQTAVFYVWKFPEMIWKENEASFAIWKPPAALTTATNSPELKEEKVEATNSADF